MVHQNSKATFKEHPAVLQNVKQNVYMTQELYCLLFLKHKSGAGKRAQLIKALAAKEEDLGSIPRVHMVEVKNRVPQVAL